MNALSYLAFNGNCQDAFHFYASLLEAKILIRQTYEDKKIDVSSSYRKKLQHAELKIRGVNFMAYDALLGTLINHVNQIHVSAEINTLSVTKDLFDNLSQGGTIYHNFREREWGHFGGYKDKCGIK